jgi:molybdopterin-guanine dinucleotide biosynthesis protein A
VEIAVCILAGGQATRLPGKLWLDAGGVPIVVQVFRNVAAGREAAIACGEGCDRAFADLPATFVRDRWPKAGPLGGLVSACATLHAPWVFAVAGDAPFVTSAILDTLSVRRETGDEAVVPIHREGETQRLEPLAALYDRARLLAVGEALLQSGARAMHALLDGLRVRTVCFEDEEAFANVNTQADYDRMQRLARKRFRVVAK